MKANVTANQIEIDIINVVIIQRPLMPIINQQRRPITNAYKIVMPLMPPHILVHSIIYSYGNILLPAPAGGVGVVSGDSYAPWSRLLG